MNYEQLIKDYLTKRYQKQCEAYPKTSEIPLQLYIKNNFKSCLDGLKEAACTLTPANFQIHCFDLSNGENNIWKIIRGQS